MEKRKQVKRVSLFSNEGKQIISQIVQVEEDKEESIRLTTDLARDLAVETEFRGNEKETKRLPGDLHCTTCDVSFSNREEQVGHYRLDWHRHNLKRRLKSLPPFTQNQFESQSGTGDLSSISGSDTTSTSDNESEPEVGGASEKVQRVPGSPLIVFTTPEGTHHAVYRSLLIAPKDPTLSHSSVMSLGDVCQPLSDLTCVTRPWIILMRSGGHFAGAVFKGTKVVCHKTFHRYTVRAKQGTMQSARDSHHGAHKPRSAGASLRRYNEAALEQEISDLLYSWKAYIDEALLIMVRVPKSRRLMFGGTGKEPLINHDDPRVRGIPFMTRRPTFSEIKSVWLKLTTIYSGVQLPQHNQQTHSRTITPKTGSRSIKPSDKMADSYMDKVADWLNDSTSSSNNEEDKMAATPKKQRKKKGKIKACEVGTREDNTDPVIKELHDLITSGDEDKVQQLLLANGLTTVDQSNCSSSDTGPISVNTLCSGRTALHLASTCGHGNIVYMLLSHGADPSIKDTNSNGVPYLVCKDRPTRDSYRRFMAHYPSMYDYNTALVPGPLTEEMEDSRRERRNERKKAQKKAQKQRKKEKANEEELSKLEKQRESTMKGLSEREKRALAAEKRMANTTTTPSADIISKYGVCSLCGSSLCGVVAFERLNYKYCSIECVREHRKQLQQ